MFNGLFLTTYFLLLGLSSTEILISELNNPIIKIFKNSTIIMGTDMHILELHLDLEQIVENLKLLETEVNQALIQLSKNIGIEEVKVIFKVNMAVKLEGKGLQNILTENLKRIQLRLSSFLVKIINIKNSFIDFLDINLDQGKIGILRENEPDIHWNEDLNIEMLKLGFSELLVAATRNKSGDFLTRSTRAIAEYTADGSVISKMLGTADLNLGKVYLANSGYSDGAFSNPNENMRINQKRMYQFENHLLYSLNITQAYLQKSARLQRKLIFLTADLARLEGGLQSENAEIELEISYLLNLIHLQYVSFQLEDNLELLKKAITSKQLSGYFMSVPQLKNYLTQLITQTEFELPFGIDKMAHIIYNYIPIEIEAQSKKIVYKIKIPLQDPLAESTSNFEHWAIKNVPFILNNSWVNIELPFKEDYIIDTYLGLGIPLEKCNGHSMIYYCHPNMLEPLNCIKGIFGEIHSLKFCNLKETMKRNFVKGISERHFVVGSVKPLNLAVSCTSEEIRRKVKVQSFQSETKLVNLSLFELRVPENCEVNFSLAFIPRKRNTYDQIRKTWERFDLDFSNFTGIVSSLDNTSDQVMRKFDNLKIEFHEMMKEFSNPTTPKFMGGNQDVFLVVQITQIIIFLSIFVITVSVCIRKKKSTSNNHQIATLGPDPKDFVIIKNLEETQEILEERDS